MDRDQDLGLNPPKSPIDKLDMFKDPSKLHLVKTPWFYNWNSKLNDQYAAAGFEPDPEDSFTLGEPLEQINYWEKEWIYKDYDPEWLDEDDVVEGELPGREYRQERRESEYDPEWLHAEDVRLAVDVDEQEIQRMAIEIAAVGLAEADQRAAFEELWQRITERAARRPEQENEEHVPREEGHSEEEIQGAYASLLERIRGVRGEVGEGRMEVDEEVRRNEGHSEEEIKGAYVSLLERIRGVQEEVGEGRIEVVEEVRPNEGHSEEHIRGAYVSLLGRIRGLAPADVDDRMELDEEVRPVEGHSAQNKARKREKAKRRQRNGGLTQMGRKRAWKQSGGEGRARTNGRFAKG